jgi:enterochelin esterase-like enzyme
MQTELLENIIPLIERKYRVTPDRTQRAIAGLSMGGQQTFAISLNNLEHFAYVAGFSSGIRQGHGAFASVLDKPAEANRQLKLLYITCGERDSLLEANQNFAKALAEKGIHHQWVQTPRYGHQWPYWRINLRDVLVQLFP